MSALLLLLMKNGGRCPHPNITRSEATLNFPFFILHFQLFIILPFSTFGMMKLFSEYSQSVFEPSGVILFLSRILRVQSTSVALTISLLGPVAMLIRMASLVDIHLTC